MSIVICPGIHEPGLTENFVLGLLGETSVDVLTFPAEGVLALSALHIFQFLGDRLRHRLESPVVFISFSAGVIGAIGAAWKWQLSRGRVKAFIAIDGWGVPLLGHFPIHRMSHDYFTHWSSSLLENQQNKQSSFYADPAVDHLEMWRSPQTVQGWCTDLFVSDSEPQKRLTAAEFLWMLLQQYEEISPEDRFSK